MKRKKYALIAGLMALLWLAPTLAQAAPMLFEPQQDDLSIIMLLQMLFAGALPDGLQMVAGATPGSDPFSGVFSVINSAALTIGGLLAAYTLVAGTMQTAHDGEMLGKRWSSMWLPIRTAFGVGLTVPLASGYCVAQLIVMWIAVQGVGLADQVWGKFVKDGMSQMAAAAVAPSPKTNDFMLNSLRIKTCMETVNAMKDLDSQKTLFGGPVVAQEFPMKTGHFWSSGQTEVGTYYGKSQNIVGSISSTNKDFCGTVSRMTTKWDTFDTIGGGMKGAAIVGATGAIVGGVVGSVVPGAGTAAGGFLGAKIGMVIGAALGMSEGNKELSDGMGKVLNAHDEGQVQLMKDLEPVAKAIVSQAHPGAGSPASLDEAGVKFDAAAKAYMDRVQTQATGVSNALLGKGLQENATSGGWLMAGAWFARVSNVINSINQVVNNVPKAVYNKNSAEESEGPMTQAMMSSMSSLDAFYRSNTALGASNAWRTNIGIDAEAASLGTKKQMEESKISKAIVESMSGLDITNLKNETRHPLIILQELGMSMIAWIAAATMVLTSLSMVLGFGALVAPLIGLVLFSGLAAATVLAIYTPLMPFLLFLGAAFGWLMLVVEAMAAAPLWAVMHLSPAGDDLMGSAKSGYSLLLSLLLRPALLIVGFAAAILIIYPMGTLLNTIFFSVFVTSSAQGGTYFSAFLLIAGTVVYAGVLLSLLHKAFSLIHKIPDELLKWFGGGGANLGQSAEVVAGGGKAAVAAMGGTAQSVANQGGQIGAQMRGNRLQKEQNKLTEANAARSAGGNAESMEMKSLDASQKAFEKPSAENELGAYNAARLSQKAHLDAADASGRAGHQGEAKAHLMAAQQAGERAKHHQGVLGKMAEESKTAYAKAAEAPTTTAEEELQLAKLARQAASAENAHGSASPTVKSDAEGGVGPKQYLEAAATHEKNAKSMSAATPPADQKPIQQSE